MWARRTRVLVIGAVLMVGLLATVLLQAPTPTQTVDEVMKSPKSLVDQDIAVRGEVRDGTIDNGTMTFILEGVTSTLLVVSTTRRFRTDWMTIGPCMPKVCFDLTEKFTGSMPT